MPDHAPPMVSKQDLMAILVTAADPTFRYTLLTHGVHNARFHIIALVTNDPADLPAELQPSADRSRPPPGTSSYNPNY